MAPLQSTLQVYRDTRLAAPRSVTVGGELARARPTLRVNLQVPANHQYGNYTADLHNLQPAWAIPSALADVLAALPEQEQFLGETLPTVRRWARDLALELGAMPTALHFFTIAMPDAQNVAVELLKHGIRVRDCASFGHPHLVRLVACTPDVNRILVRVWRNLYGP